MFDNSSEIEKPSVYRTLLKNMDLNERNVKINLDRESTL